ncbi:hypothetical protein LCM10_03820 [Rossellomorea aquimaris]|uniref:hypothetical protein n=1 Tax=Rossellomorea aquimaris TaxID=189382 RepID=UPI001CD4557A|nr:hypothetical protein [Rossellomorea aquimaris]MCA1054103.1 hypothetical protein [Rossellomorea aquimaris]
MDITIMCKNNTEKEQDVRNELEQLIAKFDLQDYCYTDVVLVDEYAIYPHSHPMLTMNTRHIGKDNLLLSTFIHEQIHWYAVQHFQKMKNAIQQLKNMYPSVPVGYPNGAKNEFSSYLHLIINWLEVDVVFNKLEKQQYEEVIHFLQHDHYVWIYRTVLADFEQIRDVLDKNEIQLTVCTKGAM